jgi:hypothetical protein
MNRPLSDLREILEYQLGSLNLLVSVDPKGPLLQILLQHVRTEPVDPRLVTTIIKDALDAAFFPDIRKVNIYTKPLRDDSVEPTWLASFAYESPHKSAVAGQPPKARHDYAAIRVSYFVAGIVSIGLFLQNHQGTNLLPMAIAFAISTFFPRLKQWVHRYSPNPIRRSLVVVGGIALGMAAVLLLQSPLLAFTPAVVVILLGSFAVGLGWN